MRAAPGLLVIDRDAGPRRALASLLRKQGYPVEVASDARSGLALVRSRPIALAVLDGELPEMESGEVIRQLHTASPATAPVVISGAGGVRQAAESLAAGAWDYFTRPILDWDRFNALVYRSLSVWGEERSRAALGEQARRLRQLRSRPTLAPLKGNSASMQELMSSIACFGPLPDPVLILGESGVGKELVAQALHEESAGQGGPFLAINCAAIQPNLFESELFGHKAGSFTGAVRDRRGLCEAAKGGTLFLDEVGELPPDMQAKLLRVIEQRRFYRVGSEESSPLQARIVAATHVDLQRAIRERRFREDLYFRLSALEVRVPPLRDRRGDIALLAYHFVDRYNERYQRQIAAISPAALRMLENRRWKRNNVRELEWAIRQAVAYAADRVELRPEDFSRCLAEIPEEGAPAAEPEGRTPEPSAAPGEPRAELEIEDLFGLEYNDALRVARRRFASRYVERCLQQADYNKTRAAEIAGMQRANFSRLLKELEMDCPESMQLPG